MSKKLIIWDFDGVISDTEKLWVENRRILLNQKFGLNWDFETANHYIGGKSDKTKRLDLEKLGIVTDEAFWEQALEMDYALMQKGIELMPDIEKIFAEKDIAQCIATGGTRDKTTVKIKSVGIEKYFPDNKIFTADQVEHGKPEPDIFLLAAKTMGYEPKDCIVIEDSLAGMTAGLRAGMEVIAFVGCEMNQSEANLQKIKELGIKHIFYNMTEVRNFVLEK